MGVDVVETITRLRHRLDPERTAGRSIGLVPTMGALHDGHLALIERARRECECVVVSIFVNALQFDREDDLQRYPRTLAADLEACRELGADVVFAPGAEEMYPSPPCCTVQVSRITDHLCGASRRGHFDGVATVVLKLFHLVEPTQAYFGEKDAQQTAVIRRLVDDVNLRVGIVEVPIVREPDGLAISSRNVHLRRDERQLALALYHALCEGRRLIVEGERDPSLVRAGAATCIPADGRLRLEYLDAVGPDDMQPVDQITGPVRLAGALWVGKTRLIDNLVCVPPRVPRPDVPEKEEP